MAAAPPAAGSAELAVLGPSCASMCAHQLTSFAARPPPGRLEPPTLALGAAWPSMCSHQVMTFVENPEYYPPGSDPADLEFREYLAGTGAASALVKALVELLEVPSKSHAWGGRLLADAWSEWALPTTTGGRLLRGDVIADRESVLDENKALKERLEQLTRGLDEAKRKLFELIPASTLSLESVLVEGVPENYPEREAMLTLRICARDDVGLVESPAPVETEPLPHHESSSWAGPVHIALPAGLAWSSTTLAFELKEDGELIAAGELGKLPQETSGSASTTLALSADRAPKDGADGSVQLSFSYSVSQGVAIS